MKIKNIQIIEVVGALAVVTSLIFVGMQLMLDRRVAIAGQYFNRAEAQRADMRVLMESDVYFEVQEERWSRGKRPLWWNEEVAAEITPLIENGIMSVKEFSLEELRAQNGVTAFDNLYFQYKQGLLNEEDWGIYRQMMKRRMDRNAIDKAVLVNDSRPIRKIVQEILDEL